MTPRIGWSYHKARWAGVLSYADVLPVFLEDLLSVVCKGPLLTIYRFAQVFAVFGVLLWIIRMAADRYHLVMQRDVAARVRTRARLGSKLATKKIRSHAASDHRPRRQLFLH